MRFRKKHESKIKIVDDSPFVPSEMAHKPRDVGRRWMSRGMIRIRLHSRHEIGVRIGRQKPPNPDISKRQPHENWREWRRGKEFAKWAKKWQRETKRGRRRMVAKQNYELSHSVVTYLFPERKPNES